MLCTHYGKLFSITNVFPIQKPIKIVSRQIESVQESQVLYPGLSILKILVRVPDRGSWLPAPSFRVLGPGSRVPGPGSQMLGFGSRIQGSGTGSWVLISDYAV